VKLHASEITGSLNISGSITPNGSGSFDLGSANAPWKDIHVMSSSIHVYDAAGPIAKLGAIRGKGFEFKDHAGALTRISGSAMKLTGNASIAGTVTSGEFVGGGAGLTGVTAEWDGTHTGNGVITGDFTVDTNTLFVDASENTVGIGTSSPGSPLHIKGSTPDLIVEDSSRDRLMGGHTAMLSPE